MKRRFNKEWYPVREVSKIIGRASSTIRRSIGIGRITKARKVTVRGLQCWEIHKDEIMRLCIEAGESVETPADIVNTSEEAGEQSGPSMTLPQTAVQAVALLVQHCERLQEEKEALLRELDQARQENDDLRRRNEDFNLRELEQKKARREEIEREIQALEAAIQ